MCWTDNLLLRLRSLFRREKLDHELDDELRFHLEQQIEENLAAGMPPGEARAAALLVAVAAVASYLPARRASRVDPLVALRYEFMLRPAFASQYNKPAVKITEVLFHGMDQTGF